MQRPTQVPPAERRRPTRLQIAVAVGVVVVIVLLLSARGIAGFYTDYLWFDSLDVSPVWRGLLFAKVGLAVLFGLLFVALGWVNLAVARRIAPAMPPPGPEEQTIAPIRAALDRHRYLVRAGALVLLGIGFAASAGSHWHEWILFRNATDFGVQDPQFGHDVGFYMFQLPFLSFTVDWLFAALVVLLLLTALAHYLNGGIRFQVPRPRVAPAVKAHLSLLLAALALVRTADYALERYELLYSERGVVRGASYTDVNAQLPALQLLMAISVLAALLFIYNIWRRGWVLPFMAVGVWVLVAFLAGVVYPSAIQRFRVVPRESTQEAQFIARNIEGTRAALGMTNVDVKQFDYDEELDAEGLVANAETIRNVRLWDPTVLRQTYQRLQEVRTFYRFNDVDVDRYDLDDELTQIMLSARELNPGSLPSDTWENRHLAFTHGYGAVLSPANAVTSDGQPDFLVRNIPPQGEPEIDQPRLYHGEGIGSYAIVGTSRDEIDYLREGGSAVTNRYDGDGGVGIGNVVRRLAFALRFADINPLISGFMTSESRILYIRDVRERVEMIAPFLHFDRDPYPVVLDGRIVWILDAYTTSDHYPYAERVATDRLDAGSGLDHPFNYVRNSVKVTVDAYDGDVTFYVVDEDDPVVRTYAKAFPDLFRSDDDVPDDLRAHFRYPEDLFRVQTDMWGRYHIDDADEFYSQSDRWNVAQDPDRAQGGDLRRMPPYYLLMRLPDADATEFLILQPFVPFSENDTRRELSAFMVAKSDPDQYGSLEVFVMPRDRQVDGPAIVNARINQDPEISQLITLLSRAGSEVLLGNLVLVPVEQSLLYVRPLYVQATGANAVPELKQVIVVFGDRIAIADTLQDALVRVFGDAPETLEEGPAGPVVPSDGEDGEPSTPSSPGLSLLPENIATLLDQAAAAFADADAALRAGNLEEYARKEAEGRAAFDEARRLARQVAPAADGGTSGGTGGGTGGDAGGGGGGTAGGS